ncbi:unnamed protein product [Dovyalis caffra]|uniref:FHA domain-containing protein n=1 Tax=Dovyalis caffra TaxID=77055 RepID=A0AAV1S6I6_9ROSI|nr:unnamed protein product [Dovyalis caffra]
MEPPMLKLTTVRGPREDAGIPSKHLVIVSESGKWSLQDFNSFNGTTLNSTFLSPNKSFDLCDCDTVKLGELTSILVQFSVHKGTSQLRRNPRRHVTGSSKVGSVATNRSRRVNEEEGKNAETREEENV